MTASTPANLTQTEADALAQRTALFDAMKAASRTTTLASFRTDLAIDNKLAAIGGYDPVTQADRGCEKALRALIEERFPNDGIFGEEFGNVRLDAPFVWVIDPIDGTRAFVSGVPLWGTLVGISLRGQPVAGLGFQPFIDEAFSAGPWGAHWAKGEALRALKTRPCARLADASLMTTTPALFGPTERGAYDALENSVRSVRYGTDWYAYALVAAGTADIVVESGLSPYDIAALIPIIEQAGGRITDWHGKRLLNITQSFNGQVLALGDPALAGPVLEILRPAAS